MPVSLPRRAVDALRRAAAEPLAGKRQTLVNEAFEAVGFPKTKPYPLAASLTPVQRALAERVVDLDVNGYPYAIPSRPAIRRRWLGLDPPGALDERHGKEPLWRTLQAIQAACPNPYEAAKRIAKVLDAFPIARRLRVFADLFTVPEPAAVYDIDASNLFHHSGLRLVEDIDAKAGRWAAAEADRLVSLDRDPLPEEIRVVVFLALARAKMPIASRWDVLLPVVLVGKKRAIECAKAIPEARRGEAIGAALRRAHPNYALDAALDLLEAFPSAAIVDAYFELCKRTNHAPRIDLPRIEKVAKKHASVRAALDARMSGRKPPLVLRVAKSFEPTNAKELSPIQKKQLVAIGTLMDEKELDAAARLAEGHWESSGTFRGLVTLTELVDASKRPAFTVWEYLGDCGSIYRAGTMDRVAMIIQCGLECEDARLHEALQLALAARDAAKRKRSRGGAKKNS